MQNHSMNAGDSMRADCFGDLNARVCPEKATSARVENVDSACTRNAIFESVTHRR
jgi:hypothetical protein